MSSDGPPLPLRLIEALSAPTQRFSRRARGLSLAFYGVVLAAVSGSLLFGNGALPIQGNIHDVFIWINAAVFIDLGLKPHIDFSSPLGVLYLYANALAWRLTSHVGDMPILVSMGFAIAMGGLLLAFRHYLRSWLVPELLMILTLLALAGRQMGEINVTMTWYGTYNRYCWVAVLVLVFVVLGRNASLLAPSGPDRLRIAVLAGILLGITFLTKISFFLSVGVIYAGWMVASDAYRDVRTWAVPAAIVAACALVATVLGVDLVAYLGDLAKAAVARESPEATGFFHPVSFVLSLILILANLLGDWVIGNWDNAVRRLILYSAISAGIFLGLSGDFAKPIEFVVLVFAYRLIDALPLLVGRPAREALLAVCASIVFVVLGLVYVALDLYAVALTATHKLRSEAAAERPAVVWSQPAPSSKALRLAVIDPHPPGQNYQLFADFITRTRPDMSVLKAIGKIQGEIFKLNNRTYIAQVEEGRDVLLRYGVGREAVVLPLEFSNPYPFLLGVRTPSGALLWYHDGTTFNGNDRTTLEAVLSTSEVVLVPHATVDPQMRLVLNEMFERYNARTSKFCEFHTGLYWSFFRSCAR